MFRSRLSLPFFILMFAVIGLMLLVVIYAAVDSPTVSVAPSNIRGGDASIREDTDAFNDYYVFFNENKNQTTKGPYFIKTGQDAPDITVAATAIKSIEARAKQTGFEGLVFKMKDTTQFFQAQTISYAALKSELGLLQPSDFSQLKHNFVKVLTSNNTEEILPEFTDDAAWSAAAVNWANLGKAANEAGWIEGIRFDTESYSKRDRPEDPSCKATVSPVDKYLVWCNHQGTDIQAFSRGKQIGEALVAEWPNAVIFTSHGSSTSRPENFAYLNANCDLNPVNGRAAFVDISKANPLLAPFLTGLVAAMEGTQAKLVEGGEFYGLRSAAEYQCVYDWAKDYYVANTDVIPDNLRSTYSKYVTQAFGIYDDNFNESSQPGRWSTSPEIWVDQLKNASQVADDYVWVFTTTKATGDWWDTKPGIPNVEQEWINAARLGTAR